MVHDARCGVFCFREEAEPRTEPKGSKGYSMSITEKEVLRAKYLVGAESDYVAVYRVIAEGPDGALKMVGIQAFGDGAGWWRDHVKDTVSRDRSEFSEWSSCRNKGEALALAEHLWNEVKAEQAQERVRDQEREQELEARIGKSAAPPLHAEEPVGTYGPDQ
jgi:hypothetical protein